MGSGEYGGNGSVHWRVTNKRDRNNESGDKPRTYHEVDEDPATGGHFVVQVFNVNIQTDVRFNPASGTLSVRVPIKHHSVDYTRQVLVTWPPDDLPWPADGQNLQAI